MATPILGSLIFQNDAQIQLGADADLLLYHKDGDGVINNTVGDLYIQNRADDKDIIFQSDDGSGGFTAYITLDGSTSKVTVGKDADFAGDITISSNIPAIDFTSTTGSPDAQWRLRNNTGTNFELLDDSPVNGSYSNTFSVEPYDGSNAPSMTINRDLVLKGRIGSLGGRLMLGEASVHGYLSSYSDLIFSIDAGDSSTTREFKWTKNSVGGNELMSLDESGVLTAISLTVSNDVDVTGSVKCTQNFRRTVTTASDSSNTHTCTLTDNDNFNIAAANAATTIALVVASENVGQSGIITITNPASVGSLSFVALPSYMLTPSGATVNFDTSANGVSVISYYVAATDKVLCNYIGDFA